MDTQNKIDTLDEALRVIFLESSKEANTGVEMQFILSTPIEVTMTDPKKALLLQKLNETIASSSLGQTLQQAMQNMNMSEEIVAEKSNLPVSVIANLKSDSIYTNNVPIVLFKNVLSALNLSFKQVETAIRKTFEILQSQIAVKNDGLSGFSLAYRKGYYTSREMFSRNSPTTDSKELFENKEAMEKYLARLNELMNN